MQVRISTRHGQLSSETQTKIEAKLEKLLRFHDRITTADVTIDLQKTDEAKIEVRLSIERSQDMIAHAQGSRLLGALDGCVNKLEEQLRRRKEKIAGHRSTGRRTEVPPQDPTEEVDAIE